MDKKSFRSRKDGEASEWYFPKFLVTQAEYDATTPEEREHYVVDESVVEPPQMFSIPEDD
jgi:hypothetical protein